MRTRPARLQDALCIYQLIESFSRDGTLLPRSCAEICKNIHTFTIVETESDGFIGCAALHIYGSHLAEVRSIVVRPGTTRHGAGSLLVRSLLHQANELGIRCICLFTRIPAFFEHFRFRIVSHQSVPDKILKDCRHCARRHACDEIAMTLGQPPNPHPGGLVQLQL
jgi:amino-acid N-acetyltransferase